MEDIGKLKICCLSDIAERLDTAKGILMDMEGGKVTGVRPDRLFTTDAVYIFINCRMPEHAKRILADQVIMDYREPMRSIAREILRESCVPEEYQVIDDRSIGASDKIWNLQRRCVMNKERRKRLEEAFEKIGEVTDILEEVKKRGRGSIRKPAGQHTGWKARGRNAGLYRNA